MSGNGNNQALCPSNVQMYRINSITDDYNQRSVLK